MVCPFETYFCVWLNHVITGTRICKQEGERHRDTIKLYRDMLFFLNSQDSHSSESAFVSEAKDTTECRDGRTKWL